MIKKFNEFIKINESKSFMSEEDYTKYVEMFMSDNDSTEEQTMNYFVDFSGSANKEYIYNFLAKTIEMCFEHNYTKIRVYGFCDKLSKPYEFGLSDVDDIEDGKKVIVIKIVDFIESQNIGMSTENFKDVVNEINDIKKEEPNANFIIFGDGIWEDIDCGVEYLKYDIADEKYLDSICVVAYYHKKENVKFIKNILFIKDYIGVGSVITTNDKYI